MSDSPHVRAKAYCVARNVLPMPHRPDGTCRAPHREPEIFMATDCFYCAANFTCLKEEGYDRARELFPLVDRKDEIDEAADDFFFEELETFYEDLEYHA